MSVVAYDVLKSSKDIHIIQQWSVFPIHGGYNRGQKYYDDIFHHISSRVNISNCIKLVRIPKYSSTCISCFQFIKFYLNNICKHQFNYYANIWNLSITWKCFIIILYQYISTKIPIYILNICCMLTLRHCWNIKTTYGVIKSCTLIKVYSYECNISTDNPVDR